MARTKLIAPFQAYHGTAGDKTSGVAVVSYSIGSANYARNYVTPAQPETAHQTTIRGYMTAAAQAFKTLTTEQVSDWRTKYASNAKVNILGQTYTLTAENAFCLINLYRQMDGQSIVTTAPAKVAPGAITSIDSVTKNGTDLEIVITHALNTGDFVMLRVTPPLPGAARNARKGDYRTITTSFASSIIAKNTSPQTITLAMDYFTLAQNNNCGVIAQPLSPMYWPGTAVELKNTVVL